MAIKFCRRNILQDGTHGICRCSQHRLRWNWKSLHVDFDIEDVKAHHSTSPLQEGHEHLAGRNLFGLHAFACSCLLLHALTPPWVVVVAFRAQRTLRA
jgi:hypothetical protein